MTPTARRSLIALGVAIVALLPACGDDDDDDPTGAVLSDDLDGSAFTATEVEGETFVDGTGLVLTFLDGGVAADAGCNSMNGSYEISGDELVVGQLAQTQQACDDALMAQDTWVAELLQGSPTITLDDDVLTLAGDDTTVTFGERTVAG